MCKICDKCYQQEAHGREPGAVGRAWKSRKTGIRAGARAPPLTAVRHDETDRVMDQERVAPHIRGRPSAEPGKKTAVRVFTQASTRNDPKTGLAAEPLTRLQAGAREPVAGELGGCLSLVGVWSKVRSDRVADC